MNLRTLESKVRIVADLLNRPHLGLGTMRRQYRVEDHAHGERTIFGPGYRSAQELWDRLDYLETGLRLVAAEPQLDRATKDLAS